MNNTFFTAAGLATLMSICSSQQPSPGGDEEFTFEKVTISDQKGAAWLKPVDLDGDGFDEYLVTCLSEGLGFSFPPVGPGGAYILKRDGGLPTDGTLGTWSTRTQFSRWANIGWPNISQLFDIDNDGIEDWVIGAGFIPKPEGRIVWMKGELNDGALSFGEPQDLDVPEAGWYHEAIPVDLDSDGDTDFVTTNNATSIDGPGGSILEWFENDGIEGVASFTRHFIAERGGTVIVAYDVDNDGDEDLILPQFFEGDALIWMEQTGVAGSAWAEHRIDNTTGKGFMVELADMNGDGQLDLLYGNHNHQDAEELSERVMGLYWWEFPPAGEVAGLSDWSDYQHTVYEGFEVDKDDPVKYGAPGVFSTGDIDGDGDLDVTVSGDGDLGLYLLVQQDPDTFDKVLVDYGVPNSGSQFMTDLDGDGDQDIIWALYGEAGGLFPKSEVNAYLRN